jgi:SAM-dependent methyltransferase
LPTPYDELPYESQPIPQTAPEQLALVSRYFGGPAPIIEGCHYLEIGCGSAANLLPLAFYRPRDTYVGLDAAETALSSGREAAERIGLDNLMLVRGELADRASWPEGPFDFVLAHGVFSWVGPEIREALLELVAASLAPEGVACVSYNAMPGFFPRALLRQTLLRFVDPAEPLSGRTARAREVASVLSRALGATDHPYAHLLVHEATRAVEATDGYVAHELIAPHNEAFWYGDFVALARERGLEPIGDNWLYQPEQRPPPEVWEAVCAFTSDRNQQNELADVLRYRQLRCTLLRRSDAPTGEPAGADLIEQVQLATPGCTVSASVAPAVERVVRAWPASIPFSEAVAAVEADVREAVKAELHEAFARGELMWRLVEPRLGSSPRAGRANALVRHEARARGIITSPTHRTWSLSPEQREDVADGRVNEPQLRRMLAAWGMLTS